MNDALYIAFTYEVRNIARKLKVDYYRGPDDVVNALDLDLLRQYTFKKPNGRGRLIPVSTEYSDSTVFLRPEDNYLLRAIHDSLHMDLDLGFDTASELKVAKHQTCLVQRSDLAYLMAIETAGQTLWHALTGAFPADQRAFADAVLRFMNERTVLEAVVGLYESGSEF